jgi:hypothetical protein
VADDGLSRVPLTPAAFLEAVAARLDRLHGADAAPVLIRGIPLKSAGTGRVYGGFVYATLRDPRTGDTITAKVPEPLAAELDWGQEAVFAGLVHYTARRGELRTEFSASTRSPRPARGGWPPRTSGCSAGRPPRRGQSGTCGRRWRASGRG